MGRTCTLTNEWRNLHLGLHPDAIALRVRAASRVTGLPVLAGIAVLSDGSKRLVSLEVCGAESGTAWEGFLQGLSDRGLKAPRLCIIDGNAGLHRAITFAWRCTKIQRGDVHKQRNILRKVPQHAHEEITNDYHLIMYASGLDAATAARDAFMKKWSKRCPGAVESLNEAGDEVLTFYSFPKQRWKTIRTTNVIERINEEFRRRVKTQGSFPSESCALVTAREARGHPPAGGGAVYIYVADRGVDGRLKRAVRLGEDLRNRPRS